MPIRITNLNPDVDIGASAWWLEVGGHHLLMDAGIHPKRDGDEALPLFKRVSRQALDAIVVSHCHHDHVGALPVALRYFPQARTFMSSLSYLLAERVLHNSVNVMQRQRDELGIREYPLYTHEEVDEVSAVFEAVKYGRPVEWVVGRARRGAAPHPTLELLDAGHALGAAGVMVRAGKRSVFYTGDVCFHDQTLLCGAQFDDVKAEVLILETTRGGREPVRGFSREAEVERLARTVVEIQERKGSVLIPAFALGRTQEILAELALMQQEGRIRRQPIYIGGLGRVFTEIYDFEAHRVRRRHPHLKLTEALDLQVLAGPQAGRMRITGSRIYVMTSGMMVENTVAHDLAIRMMGDERHAILFVGYTDPETPGGRLRESRVGVPFRFSREATEAVRRCRMETFDLSAHAEREDLMSLVGRVGAADVVLGHGDGPARGWFHQEIRRRHPGIRVHEPGPGGVVEVSGLR